MRTCSVYLPRSAIREVLWPIRFGTRLGRTRLMGTSEGLSMSLRRWCVDWVKHGLAQAVVKVQYRLVVAHLYALQKKAVCFNPVTQLLQTGNSP